MPKYIIPPVATPFLGSINGLSAGRPGEPPEGRKSIQANILWSTDGGANNAVIIDVSSSQIQTISQIKCLFIDNSNCGVPLLLYFSDTQQRIVIPAQAVGYYPIITNLLNFTIWCDGLPGGTDYSIINVLNYERSPIEYAAIASVITTNPFEAATAITNTGNYVINIASGPANYIITDLQMNIAGTLTNGAALIINLINATPSTFERFELVNNSANSAFLTYTPICEQHGMQLFMNNGIQLQAVLSGANCSLTLSINMQIITL